MARVDSILAIVHQQGANELRMGTDREPKMFAFGTQKKLAIPKTPEDTLRDLLGDILTSERESTMRARGRIEVAYEAGGLGAFGVTLYAREKGFDVVFVKRMSTRTITGRNGPIAPPPPQPQPVDGAELAAFDEELPVAETRPSEVPRAAARPLSALPDPILPEGPPASTVAVAMDARSPFAQLVAAAAILKASDLHLADGEAPRVRIDGSLQRVDRDAPIDVAPILDLAIAEQERLAAAGSIDLARDVPGVGRVRLHAYRTADGLAAAIRLLPRAAPALSALHLPMALDDLVAFPHGLVIVCGATGSGKSTTLAALAQEALRRRSIVLTTLEDPIEFALSAPGGSGGADRGSLGVGTASIVRRRQIGRDARDFASGLRDALREDPDVLLVGEMRDPETIALALTAAETGHLVLASMHSRSAASAIERIVDSYPAGRESQIRGQLADSLRAVVAQRLLPRARGGGRVPCVELLRVTHAVGALIRDGKVAQIASAMQSGKREGMLSLERCLADRVQAGEIRVEDARAVANDPASLAMYMQR